MAKKLPISNKNGLYRIFKGTVVKHVSTRTSDGQITVTAKRLLDNVQLPFSFSEWQGLVWAGIDRIRGALSLAEEHPATSKTAASRPTTIRGQAATKAVATRLKNKLAKETQQQLEARHASIIHAGRIGEPIEEGYADAVLSELTRRNKAAKSKPTNNAEPYRTYKGRVIGFNKRCGSLDQLAHVSYLDGGVSFTLPIGEYKKLPIASQSEVDTIKRDSIERPARVKWSKHTTKKAVVGQQVGNMVDSIGDSDDPDYVYTDKKSGREVGLWVGDKTITMRKSAPIRGTGSSFDGSIPVTLSFKFIKRLNEVRKLAKQNRKNQPSLFLQLQPFNLGTAYHVSQTESTRRGPLLSRSRQRRWLR